MKYEKHYMLHLTNDMHRTLKLFAIKNNTTMLALIQNYILGLQQEVQEIQ